MAKRRTPKAADGVETADERTIPGAWVSASLIPGESSTSYNNQNTGRDYELVTRGITGTAYRAATINATVLAGQTLRLFRKAGTGIAKAGRKVADRRLAKHATNRGRVKSLIGKAATYANRAGDDVEEVLDHPVLDLLQNPDPIYTGSLWLHMIFWFKEVAGRAYLYVGEKVGGVPVSAYILPSQFAWPMLSETGLIAGYYYGRNRSNPMRVASEDVVYLRQHGSPVHPAGGMSWLFSVMAETDMEAAALQAEAQRWLNGGMPGMVFKAAPTTTDAQMRQINAHLNQSTRGVGKAGSILLLRDTELIQYGTKPHEMQYVEGITTTEKRVYDAAGIPEPIYRLNSANLASATVANAQYMRYTIAPRLAVLAGELTELLLPHYGVEPGDMWFCFDDPTQDDQIALASELRAAEAQGLVSPNEYRAVMDLEALPDESNLLRYRQTEAPAPMGIFGGTPAKAEDMPSEDVGEASVDVEAEDDAKPEAQKVDVSAGDPVAEIAAAATNVSATALNGAQVQALASLAEQVATGQLPMETARAIAGAAFPTVDPAVLDSVFEPLDTFTPEHPEPATAAVAKSIRAKAEGFKPTDAMAEEAQRGLDWRAEYGRGGTEVGVARARDIVNKRNLSLDTVYRMASYFARHEVDKQGQGWNRDEDGYPSAGRIAWALWGGDPGRTWADAIVEKDQGDDTKSVVDRPRLKVPKRYKGIGTAWNDELGVPMVSSRVYAAFIANLEAWYARVVPSMVDDTGLTINVSAEDMADLDRLADKFMAEVLEGGALDGFDKIGLTGETFNVGNEDAMAYIRNASMQLCRSVADTLKPQVQAAIEKQLALGTSVADLRDAIREAAPDLTEYQAVRIARTETANAYTQGNLQAWRQAGVQTKQWLIAGGPCPTCAAIADAYPGEIPINQAFEVGGFSGQGPAAHPNCRCALTAGVEYVDED